MVQRSITRMHVTHGKKGQSDSIRPNSQVSSYGLDSIMNLDALRIRQRDERRKKEKERGVWFEGQLLL